MNKNLVAKELLSISRMLIDKNIQADDFNLTDELIDLVEVAYDRFTDNDMMPPDYALRRWINTAQSVLNKARRFSASDKMTATIVMEDLVDLPKMSISEIATLIGEDWKNVNYAARPYLEAMSSMDNINDNYGMDSGVSIVSYFLSNSSGYKGEASKLIKKELNRRLKSVH